MAIRPDAKALEGLDRYKYGFSDPDVSVFRTPKGLSREVVEQISAMKGEPEWMLKFRLKALEHFLARPMPTWGPDLSGLNLDEIYYYVRPAESERKRGTKSRTRSRTPSTGWASPRPSRSSWPGWAPSTSRRWSITTSRSTSKSRA